VLSAATAGGPGPDNSASVGTLEITDKKGNGNIPFLTIRTFSGTLPSTTVHVPSAQYPNPLPLKVSLNSNGTGELLVFDFPVEGDITHHDIVFKKIDGIVTTAFMIKTGVCGPSAGSEDANEIKLFELERQETFLLHSK
jgi:hypothetical protein